MYSVPAVPPNAHHTTRVKANPMLIHTTDSTAASLVVTSWASRWNTTRSTNNSSTMNANSAAHPHSGTVMSAK